MLQMLKFGARMVAPVTVERIEPSSSPNDYHVLHLDCGTKLRARTVLIATGVNWRKLGPRVPSSSNRPGSITPARRLRRSSTTGTMWLWWLRPATRPGRRRCSSVSAAADRTIHLLIRKQLGPGMSEYLVGRIRSAPNIRVHEGVEISAVHGRQRLESVTLRAFTPDGDSTSPPNPDAATTATLPVAAVFVFIGAGVRLFLAARRHRPGQAGLSIDRHRHSTVRPLADCRPRALPAGDDRPADPRRRRRACGVDQTSGVCGGRRVAGGDVRAQIDRN